MNGVLRTVASSGRWTIAIACFWVLLHPGLASAQTLEVSLHQDPAGITMSGSGTGAASIDFGVISRFGLAPSGVDLTTSTAAWTLSTYFGVRATLTSGTSSSYRLQGQLQSADADRTWKINGQTLSSGIPVDVMQNGSYDTVLRQTLSITIPDSSAPGAMGNVIELTVIAN